MVNTSHMLPDVLKGAKAKCIDNSTHDEEPSLPDDVAQVRQIASVLQLPSQARSTTHYRFYEYFMIHRTNKLHCEEYISYRFKVWKLKRN